jgi:Terpene synthase family 2, C-terminal metal binding
MFLDEAKLTMEMLAVQQQLRINGKIPTLEEYHNYRQGSCCINSMLALVEYAF